MTYTVNLYFKDEPECSQCKLNSAYGSDIKDKVESRCNAISTRPRCSSVGSHVYCPLKPSED